MPSSLETNSLTSLTSLTAIPQTRTDHAALSLTVVVVPPRGEKRGGENGIDIGRVGLQSN